MSQINPGVGAGGGGGGGAVTIADGSDVAEGATTDAAVVAGSTGTVSGKLRQISSDVSSVKSNQTNASQKTQVVDGSGNVIGSTSNALDVNIKSGGGSGFSVTDESAWTAGSSAMVPSGAVFNDSATALTSGQQGTIRSTSNRAIHSNIRNASGTELATASNPIRVDPTGTTTQPVSGTVTANVGTTNGLALDASVTGLQVSQGSTTSGQKGDLIQGAVTTAAPSYTTAQTNPLSLTTSGALRTDSSATTQPVSAASLPLPAGAATSAKQPALGTAGTPSADVITVQGVTSMTALKVDGSGVTQPVSGTVTANAGTNLNTSALALESGGNLAIVAGAVTASVVQENVKQINGVVPLMGNGVTGTGSQRVTIASDNTPFSVNSTLSAETTKVIGVVRTADGSGNLLTSTTNALDINIKSGSIANTSFAVTQATASSLNATVTQGPAAAITGGWVTIAGETADTTGTFTNATQTTSITATGLSGYQAATVSINGTYGIATAVFEGSDDGGTTWYALQAGRTDAAIIENGYTSLTNVTRMWTLEITSLDSFRVRSTAVASGTVNVRISISAAPTSDAANVSIGSALPTGSNTIGALTANQSVNVSQVSGTTASVNNGTTDAGTQRVTLSSDSTGQVKLATGSNAIGSITNTSFAATQSTAANLNATVVGTGTFAVQAAGDVASGSSDSGNPLKQGAVAHTAAPTAVTDGQRVNLIADKVGKQVVVGSIRDLKGNQFTTITSSTSETNVVTAVASTFLDVYGCIVENTSATASKVTFKDSTAGTTQFEIYVPAGDTRGFMLPESGAFKQTTVNNNWTATCGTSVASIVISMLYVKNI